MSEYETSAPPPPPPVAAVAPQEERTMALVAHLLGILTWFVGALIIWLINKDATPAKPFVTDQAKEALNFAITLAIIGFVLLMITLLSLGIGAIIAVPLLLVVGVAAVIRVIIAAVKANEGVAYRYPFTIRLIK